MKYLDDENDKVIWYEYNETVHWNGINVSNNKDMMD